MKELRQEAYSEALLYSLDVYLKMSISKEAEKELSKKLKEVKAYLSIYKDPIKVSHKELVEELSHEFVYASLD